MGRESVDQALRIKEACFGINGKCIIDKVCCEDGTIRSMSVRELYQRFVTLEKALKIYDSSIQDYTPILTIFKFPDPHNWIIFRCSDSHSILLAANAKIRSKSGLMQAWELRINDQLITTSGRYLQITQKEDLGFLCQSSFCILTKSGSFDCNSLRLYFRSQNDQSIQETIYA